MDLSFAGLSVAGLAVSLAVLLPNLLLAVAPPRNAMPVAEHLPRAVTVLERVGQAGCLALPALTGAGAALDVRLVAVVVPVGCYWALWGRYLRGRRAGLLYAPVGSVPVPMALTPVLAFLSAALWLASWPTALAAVVLALGHVPTAVATARALGRPGRAHR